jgi:hypothetical protein
MKINSIKVTNLAEAQASLSKLQPYLPWPRLTEKMNFCGILPDVGSDTIGLPITEQPEVLVANLGPFVQSKLPVQWKAAHYFHRQRLRRNAQVQRLYPACQITGDEVPADLDQGSDGVVAGMLLLALRPMPSPLRTALLEHAHKHWWGMYFALLGVVYEKETTKLIAGVASEPRLTAALYRVNSDLAAPLTGLAHRQNDIWSSTISLKQPNAAEWLNRVVTIGLANSNAAVTALALQPSAPNDFKSTWIDRLRNGNPRLAYFAVRLAQHTWPIDEWRQLRDDLASTACHDQGQFWFHWFRDIAPERIAEALGAAEASVLWQAELAEHAKSPAHELHERMKHQLDENPADNEARFALRWLIRRGKLS